MFGEQLDDAVCNLVRRERLFRFRRLSGFRKFRFDRRRLFLLLVQQLHDAVRNIVRGERAVGALLVLRSDIFDHLCRDPFVVELVGNRRRDAGNPRFIDRKIEFVFEHARDLFRNEIVIGEGHDVRHAVGDGVLVGLGNRRDHFIGKRIFIHLRKRGDHFVRNHIVIGFGQHGRNLFRKHAVVEGIVERGILRLLAHSLAVNGLRNFLAGLFLYGTHLFAHLRADLFHIALQFAADTVHDRLNTAVQRLVELNGRLFQLLCKNSGERFVPLFECSVARVHLLCKIAVDFLHLQIHHTHIRCRIVLGRLFELNVEQLGERAVHAFELFVDGTHIHERVVVPFFEQLFVELLAFFLELLLLVKRGLNIFERFALRFERVHERFAPLGDRTHVRIVALGNGAHELGVALVDRAQQLLGILLQGVDPGVQPILEHGVQLFELLADRAGERLGASVQHVGQTVDLRVERFDERRQIGHGRRLQAHILERFQKRVVRHDAVLFLILENRAVLLGKIMQLVDNRVEALFQRIHHRLVGIRLLFGAVLNLLV